MDQLTDTPHLFLQEKYVNAICQKVFQKFPDFVQRCKDEAFEALSDPMYSGKMKVQQSVCGGGALNELLRTVSFTVLYSFFSGVAKATPILSAKERQSSAFFTLNKGMKDFFGFLV